MYWHWILLSFVLAAGLSPLVARAAAAFGIVDEPGEPRKIHREPIPLLGGLGIFISIGVVLVLALTLTDRLTVGEIDAGHYAGFLIGGAILMLGGFLDDRFKLAPRFSILFPIAAALAAILGGVEVTKLTNPMGGVVFLEPWQSNVLVFVWLMIVIYVTKLLDGLDGLSTSVVSVGTFAILLLSLSAAYFQPDVALFASIGLGALLGFLVWNWSPAKVFLGEGGSTFVGYLLGVLAVISGGKLATALLVLGIPLLDLAWTIIRRSRNGAAAIVSADRKHLHHRLLDLGWSQPRIVFLYTFFALVFGVGALFLQSGAKFLALLALVVLMVVVGFVLVKKPPLLIEEGNKRGGIKKTLCILALPLLLVGALLFVEREMATITLADGTKLTVEIAETPAAKMRGLSGRDEIPRGGMLFVYNPPQDAQIWMKDMNFPIDIAWIADGNIVHIVENAPPDDSPNREIYRAGKPVDYVLELPSGTVDRLGIEVGDHVTF